MSLLCSTAREGDPADDGEALYAVIGDFLAHRVGNGVGTGPREEKRVPVGRGPRDIGSADQAPGTGTVVHNHGLSENLGKAIGDRARGQINIAAGRKRRNQIDRPVREVLLRSKGSGKKNGGDEGRAKRGCPG